ncbi:glycoside hydrolase family 18 protein, partial [Amniculicola lignicola CBS 123094]
SIASCKSLVTANGQVGDPDYTCSPTKPCALGCCGKSGVCGMGPSFCSSQNCTNSCGAKSECDPGGWGPQYATNTKCPLNVCCSKYGFCGTKLGEFCQSEIANPSCPGGTSANQRTIGYYEGWAVGRKCDAMFPEDIPVRAYTHLNYAFALIDPSSFSITFADVKELDLCSRLTGLKTIFPELRVWISIGGWAMNDPDQPTYTTFSDLAGSVANQQKFFSSLISFMSQYGFDGVDIDWEYPVAPERGGRPDDYRNYPIFLANLNRAFASAGKDWGTSLTIPSAFWYLQHFDIVKIAPPVDYINLMSLTQAHTNLTEIDAALKLLWRNSIDPSKVILGLGFYGRSFALADPACSSTGCRFSSGAPAGACTGSVGTLSASEIQRLIAAGAEPQLDREAAVQTLTYEGKHWVSYDDEVTFKMKMDYANRNCLGGSMVWAVSLDSPEGSSASALLGGPRSPRAERLQLSESKGIGMCRWTGCRTIEMGCEKGETQAWTNPEGCPQDGKQAHFRSFCCPSNDVPVCYANGRTIVNGECRPNECPKTSVLLQRRVRYVWTNDPKDCNHVCCTNKKSITAITSKCIWAGTPPNCESNSCPQGYRSLTESLTGNGDSPPCQRGRQRLCCPDSRDSFDAGSCSWFGNYQHGICTPGCPKGRVMVAIDSAGPNCRSGSGSYCCDPPLESKKRSDSDPDVREFRETVADFFARGQCAKRDPALKFERRQSSSKPIPFDRELARLLVPVLSNFGRSSTDQESFGPYERAWNDNVRDARRTLPLFSPLATALTLDRARDSTLDSVSWVRDVLCSRRDSKVKCSDRPCRPSSDFNCNPACNARDQSGVPPPRDELRIAGNFTKQARSLEKRAPRTVTIRNPDTNRDVHFNYDDPDHPSCSQWQPFGDDGEHVLDNAIQMNDYGSCTDTSLDVAVILPETRSE